MRTPRPGTLLECQIRAWFSMAMMPSPRISFEHAVFLVTALAKIVNAWRVPGFGGPSGDDGA